VARPRSSKAPSPVYFANMRTAGKSLGMVEKAIRLFERAGFPKFIAEDDLVAVKLHFGEEGNTAYLRPAYVRPIVDRIKACGGKPFLTDSNTLYRGQRANSVDHINVAVRHGFSHAAMGAPIIIADGLTGRSFQEVPVGKRQFESVHMAADLYHASAAICLVHFKGHCQMGIGGAMKHISMGFANRGGKQALHSQVYPEVNEEECEGCGLCAKSCPADAIAVEDRVAVINTEKCIGCGECTPTCPTGAIGVRWGDAPQKEQERVAEFCWAVMKAKKGRIGFMSFLMDITPDCDCYGKSDAPIVDDIGILASQDPVAIDQAAIDLVNRQPGRRDSALQKNHRAGADKIRGIHPNVDYTIQLAYGEEIGVGSRAYKLIEVA